jgi:hypothetical protein
MEIKEILPFICQDCILKKKCKHRKVQNSLEFGEQCVDHDNGIFNQG